MSEEGAAPAQAAGRGGSGETNAGQEEKQAPRCNGRRHDALLASYRRRCALQLAPASATAAAAAQAAGRRAQQRPEKLLYYIVK